MRVVIDPEKVVTLERKERAEQLLDKIRQALPHALGTVDRIELTSREMMLLIEFGHIKSGYLYINIDKGDPGNTTRTTFPVQTCWNS